MKPLTTTVQGWVIVATDPKEDIYEHTFQPGRQRCIDGFVRGGTIKWPEWKRKYGYRCVRATQTIVTEG